MNGENLHAGRGIVDIFQDIQIAETFVLPDMRPYHIKKADQQLEQISVALDRNPQLKTIVEQLETHYEDRATRRKEEETPRLSPEVEKFLMEMDKRFREG